MTSPLTAPPPKLSARLAPNSIEASSDTTPLGDSVIPKKPPPPRAETVSVNGCSRVEKKNETVSGSVPTNGTFSAAPIDTLARLKMPTATLGSGNE